MASLGTAYVDVAGDFTTLQSQVAAQVAPLTSRFGKLGAAAAVGTGAIVVGAVAAGKALYDIGARFDDAYDTIRVGTGATGKQLERLKSDFKNVVSSVPTDFDSAGIAIAGLNSRLNLTGKPLRSLSKQLLELSRITGTDVADNTRHVAQAFRDWSISTKDQGKLLDYLFRASQKTGLSVAKIAESMGTKFGSLMREFGMSAKEAAAMFALFEKEGVNVAKMVPGLNIAMSEFLSQDIDPRRGLLRAFKDIRSGAMSSSEAIELFGRRAGADVIDAVKNGRFEFQDLVKALENGDDSILKASKETMDFAEAMVKLGNQLAVVVEPLATPLFNAIGQGALKASYAFQRFTKEGSAARKGIDGLITVIKLFGIAWIAGLKMAWNAIKMFFTIVGGVMKGVGFATRNASRAVGAAFNAIKSAASSVASFVKNRFNDVIGFLRGLPGRARNAGEAIGRAIKNGVVSAIRGLEGLVKGIVNGAINAVKGLANSFIGRANQLIAVANKLPGANIPRIPTLATGTRSAPGGMALVGEQGPELVNLPRGAAVYTASQTSRILSGGPAPLPNMGPPQVRVFIGDRELTDIVRVEMGERDRVAAGAYAAGVVG